MSNLKLERPLAIFDLEATGLNARADRIVEISIVKLMPDGSHEVHTFRVNPEMPIPMESQAIHGISDADVADCPTFDSLAPKINELLADCDLGGFSVINFDIPMLEEEFMRARITFDMTDRRIVDAQRIFHKKEPRNLTAAVKFYCNDTLENAHGAEADAVATMRVIEGQLEKYSDLPTDVDGLDKFSTARDVSWADRSGKLKWINGDIAINFGKKRGKTLRTLAEDDRSYLRWIMKSDFPRDTQEIVSNAMEGTFPDAPATD